MTSTTEWLPLVETIEPTDAGEVAAIVRNANERRVPVYPIGGGTSLDYGLPAKTDGWGLSLKRLNSVVDYPARDLTVTVEAGVTMERLAELLAAEGQQLPIDVPAPDLATIGGVVATNFNGPRRYGMGGVRDQVIGVHAVDGRGTAFKGGGRVVKNVAGYDFCKLLTGSLGTLGIITQLTLKLRPLAERSAFVVTRVDDRDRVEELLAQMVHSRTAPTSINVLQGPAWSSDPLWDGGPAVDGSASRDSDAGTGALLAVGLEGTGAEVEWMIDGLRQEWRDLGGRDIEAAVDEQASQVLRRLTQFPAEDAPLVVKAAVTPSRVTRMMMAAREIADDVSLLSHAGNGVVFMRFPHFPEDGLSRTVVGKLQGVAAEGHGHVTVLSNPSRAEMTHQSVWGSSTAPYDLMTLVKRNFDPRNVLNPGRFIYT